MTIRAKQKIHQVQSFSFVSQALTEPLFTETVRPYPDIVIPEICIHGNTPSAAKNMVALNQLRHQERLKDLVFALLSPF